MNFSFFRFTCSYCSGRYTGFCNWGRVPTESRGAHPHGYRLHWSLTRSVFLKWAIVSSHFACPSTTGALRSANQRKIYFLRGGFSQLCREMSNAQARHSCRGKWLDRRSRHRRDEALPSTAHRKWQEAGHGACITVDGCHHSGGADGTVGRQTWI